MPLDQAFWDPSRPWNNLGNCVWDNHAVFSDDGRAMYASRYSALQVIDSHSCLIPRGDLSLDPQPVFPGDTISVTNTSLGGDRYATWITAGPDPHGDTILAGSISFAGGTVLGYIPPADMSASDEFWAHAAVENNLYPYFPGRPPAQIKTEQIIVDRRPEAAISLSPQVAVTGDTVSLVAETEVHPAVPGGGDPFAWTVTDPSGGQLSYVGSPSGGQGCDGSTTFTCTEPSYPGCDRAAFAYAGGGAKTVRVTVTTTSGIELPEVQVWRSHDGAGWTQVVGGALGASSE